MARMKAIQAAGPGADWDLVERDIPQPEVGQVRIKSRGLRRLPQ